MISKERHGIRFLMAGDGGEKEEMLEMLGEYKKRLEKEAKGVAEKIKEIESKK